MWYTRFYMPILRPQSPQVIHISTTTFLRVIALTLGVGLLWYLRDVVAMVFLAVLLSALIDPFADWCANRHIPRGIAVLLVYVGLATLFIGVFVLLVPIVFQQSTQLIHSISDESGKFAQTYLNIKNYTVEHGFADNIRSSLESIQQGVAGAFSSVFSTLKGLVGGIATLFVVLVLAFYLVVEEEAAARFFRHLAPEEYQPYLAGLFTRMQEKVGAWLRGQLILGFLIATMVYVGLLILGVPYALLLAVLAGMFEVIPYIGPIVSFIPSSIIGFAQSTFTGLLVIGMYVLVQQFENHVLVPKVMQKATGLNPIASIIALLIGIKLGGFIGAVLSIPVATMCSVIAEDVFGHRQKNS